MLRSPELLMVLEREKKMFSRAYGAEKHLCSGPRLTASEAKTGRQPPGELNASLHHQSSLGDPTEGVQWEASGLTPHWDLGQGEGCARPGKWVRIWSSDYCAAARFVPLPFPHLKSPTATCTESKAGGDCKFPAPRGPSAKHRAEKGTLAQETWVQVLL